MPIGNIAQSEDIIGRRFIKPRERYEHCGRDVPLAKFIIAVYLLRAMQDLCHFPLRQVVVLTQVANPLIHNITGFIICYNILRY